MSSTAMITAGCPEPCDPDLQLLDMPASLLVMIMQHVPLQQRLGVCTRVCHAFHTAAVAATDSISIMKMSSQAQCNNLSEWLQLHGGGVTCLDIQDGRGLSLACWPCPVLRTLNLHKLAVQPGFFSACTSLTRLLLNHPYLHSRKHASSSAAGSNPLAQLSVLCSLQHLDLGAVRPSGPGLLESAVQCEVPGWLVSQLVQLTCLKLRDNLVQSDAALQHLSALSALQHLELSLQGGSRQKPTAAALTGLQQLPQLTALKLTGVPWAINLQSVPAFTVLTALLVLQLGGTTWVDHAVLAAINGLQQLDLSCKPRWAAGGSAAMLAAISQQQGLVRLKFGHHCYRFIGAASCSALTASSHLQHLELESADLPEGAWQQMFPPTRCLPELSHLVLWADDGPTHRPLSEADMQAMVTCCPGLVNLALGPKLLISSATPLQQLTGLSTLQLCAPFQDSAPSFAQLTRLQRLAVESYREADRVTVSGLLQLTVLQQLRDISVTGAAWDLGLAPLVSLKSKRPCYPSDGPCLMVYNKVGHLCCGLSLPWSAGQQHAKMLPTSLHRCRYLWALPGAIICELLMTHKFTTTAERPGGAGCQLSLQRRGKG